MRHITLMRGFWEVNHPQAGWTAFTWANVDASKYWWDIIAGFRGGGPYVPSQDIPTPGAVPDATSRAWQDAWRVWGEHRNQRVLGLKEVMLANDLYARMLDMWTSSKWSPRHKDDLIREDEEASRTLLTVEQWAQASVALEASLCTRAQKMIDLPDVPCVDDIHLGIDAWEEIPTLGYTVRNLIMGIDGHGHEILMPLNLPLGELTGWRLSDILGKVRLVVGFQ